LEDSSRRTSARTKLLLGLLGVGLGVLAAEALCCLAFDVLGVRQQRPSRVFGLIYENTPGFLVPGNGWSCRFNRWGLVGEDHPLRKPAGERRIVLLGDSVAMGINVRAEHSTAAILEKELNRRGPRGSRTRLLNFGVMSYNLWDYYYCLRAKGWRFEPDGVLLFLCLNDAWPKALGLPLPGKGGVGLWPRAKHLLVKSRFVYTCLYVLDLKRFLVPFFGPAAGLPAKGLPSDPRSVSLLDTLDPSSRSSLRETASTEGWSEEALRDSLRAILLDNDWPKALPVLGAIADECRRRGVPFKVAVFPVSFQVRPGYRDGRPQKEIMAYLRAEGIEAVDLRPALSAASRRGRMFLRGDLLHPTEEGHRVASLEILKMF
jgi:lysophospholipase L1-like esterase